MFEHFLSKLLDPQKSLFGDVILEMNYFLKWSYQKTDFTKVGLLNWYSLMKISFRKIQIIFKIENDFEKSQNFAILQVQ